MADTALRDLETRIAQARDLDEALLHDAAAALGAAFKDAPTRAEVLSEPTEAVMHMVDRCLPGWSIVLRGRAIEPDGHWSCTLREGGSRDDDAVIGHSTGPTVALAALGALISVGVKTARA